MTVVYEWVVEYLDDIGDIVSVEHWDAYKHAAKSAEPGLPDHTTRIGLVRDRLYDDQLTERLWAYVVDGVLPETFEDCGAPTGFKVPQSFRNEVARYHRS